MNHCEKIFGNRPLNAEITTKKESEKFKQSKQSKQSEAQSLRK